MLAQVECRRWRHVTRRRLKPQQRRGQLIDIGAALFAYMPYEDVWMEDIGARGRVESDGVSLLSG